MRALTSAVRIGRPAIGRRLPGRAAAGPGGRRWDIVLPEEEGGGWSSRTVALLPPVTSATRNTFATLVIESCPDPLPHPVLNKQPVVSRRARRGLEWPRPLPGSTFDPSGSRLSP